MAGSSSSQTMALLLGAVALMLYMQAQSQQMFTHNPASVFGGGVAAGQPAAMPSDHSELDAQIEARRTLVTQLQASNEQLKQQQDQILSQVKTGTLRGPVAIPATPVLQMPVAPAVAAPTAVAAASPVLPSISAPQAAAVAPAAAATPVAGGDAVIFRHQSTGRFISVITSKGGTLGWLRCDADDSYSLASRAFQVVPQDGGWVALKSLATQRFVEMVPKTQPLAWVVRATGSTLTHQHHFKLDGNRILNRALNAYVNVIKDGGGIDIRGHGNAPNKKSGAGREASTVFEAMRVSKEQLLASANQVNQREMMEKQKDQEYIAQIAAFPKSNEKRVVSYGLYGSNPKYIDGAVRNSELVKLYFPGWVCRFYVDGTVPQHKIAELTANGAEIIPINNIKGGIAGMFWRFMVADDNTVDRWIVRDSDSRLNPRERFAVEEWIQSGKAVHTIRDHPNHERPLNGGLWGGTKGAVKGMTNLVKQFSNKQSYGGDLQFLGSKIWPQIKDNQIGHDAYTCHKFPNSHPFPTKRPDNYQHVGQVFGENMQPRMGDIDGFMRGVKVPPQCRKQKDWVYG